MAGVSNDPHDIGTVLDAVFTSQQRKREGRPSPMAMCPRCNEPLVSTIEFSGAEFICMVCRDLFGFLAPKPAEPTDELHARHDELRGQYEAERAERQGGDR